MYKRQPSVPYIKIMGTEYNKGVNKLSNIPAEIVANTLTPNPCFFPKIIIGIGQIKINSVRKGI